MNGHRKLLIFALNELLAKKLVSLDDPGNFANEDGHLFIDIAGQPSVVNWSSISGGELRLSVWWKYDHLRHPQANLLGNECEKFTSPEPLAKEQHYPKFVGAFGTGWVERRTGKWLQGMDGVNLHSVYTRRGEKTALDAIPTPVPNGFDAEGKFFS